MEAETNVDAAFLANVLVATSLYGLVAIGYVVVYRASRVLNFAQGHFMMLGAYLLFSFTAGLNVHPLLMLPVAAALGFGVGVATYLLLLKPLAGRPPFTGVLVTIALGTTLGAVVTLIWTARARYANELGLANPVQQLPGGIALTNLSLALVVSFVVVFVGLLVLLRATRIGVQMRASAENARLAAHRGVKIDLITSLAWGIAAFAGALAGMFYSLNSHLDPGLSVLGLKAFPAALVGGLDSVVGAALGALIVALAEALALRYVDPLLSQVAPYLVMLIALIIRPWGLLGTKEELDRV